MNDEDLVFHYHREERLENATPTVRDFYEGKGPTAPKGIFEALVHTKASRYSLFALILVLAFFLGFYFFGSKSYEDSLNGINYSLSAFEFEDNIYVSIKLTEKSTAGGEKVAGGENATTDDEKSSTDENASASAEKEISVQICAIDNENQIVDKIIFTKNDLKDGYFRTVFFNHDIIKITAEITDEESQSKIQLSTKVTGEKK